VGVFTTILRGALLIGCMLLGVRADGDGVGHTFSQSDVVDWELYCFSSGPARRCVLSVKSVKWEELKMLLNFGIVILVVGVANSMATESPKQIVAKTISLEALGLFGIPLVLIGYYRMLIITLTRVFSPRFSYLSGRKAEDEIRPLFVQGCRYMAMLAGAVAVLMWSTGAVVSSFSGREKPLIVSTVPALSIMVGGTFVFSLPPARRRSVIWLGSPGTGRRVGNSPRPWGSSA